MRIWTRVAALAVAAMSVVAMAGTSQAASPSPAATKQYQVIRTAHVEIPAASPKGIARPNTGGNCDYYVSCTSLSNGTLYVSVLDAGSSPSEVLDQYSKTGGGTISADFEYNDGSSLHYDQGTFSQSSGQTKSYEWYQQYLPSCAQVVGILAVRGQGNFQTPPVYMC